MTAPAVREFPVRRRGEIRDLILDTFRAGLRNRTDPETGELFTEDEIARATQAGSRWYRQAQGVDDYGQGEQRRALFLADQLQIDRASTAWLENYHARQWDPEGRLKATRASGDVVVEGTAGVHVNASTTVPDLSAYVARAPNGRRYQVFLGGDIESGGGVTCKLVATDPGKDSNLDSGTVLTWVTRDPSMKPQCVATSDFTGGTDQETDAQWARRMLDGIRKKQGAGNNPQQRAWARRSSNAIENGFVYPCAFHAGSTLICVLQKRSTSSPTSRIANSIVLGDARAYLTPPASPVQPPVPVMLVTTAQSVPSDVCVHLSLQRGVDGGWTDGVPWPTFQSPTPAYISAVSTQTNFTLYSPGDADLPGGVTSLSGDQAPHLMVWHASSSSFERLSVDTITRTGANTFNVVLSQSPMQQIVTADRISPDTSRRAAISAAFVAYFDSRGPGELFDATIDTRAARALRYPSAVVSNPPNLDSEIATWALRAAGAAAAELAYASPTTPGQPSNLSQGPNMLTLNRAGVYAL